jgi:hypothetical protein
MSFWVFIEMFLFVLAGQYIHVLIKMRNAKKQFGAAFKVETFFSENKLNLIINGSLILILSMAFWRAGVLVALDTMKLTTSAIDFVGIAIPGDVWLGLLVYIAYLTMGYSIQSIFYWLMKGGLKKANIEVIDEEKTP